MPAPHSPPPFLLPSSSPSQLDKAIAAVAPLLSPSAPAAAEHKRRQLLELATINGTLKWGGGGRGVPSYIRFSIYRSLFGHHPCRAPFDGRTPRSFFTPPTAVARMGGI